MIEVHSLGASRIEVHTTAGRVRITPAAGKRFGLVLYLICQPRQRALRSTLRDLLFPPTKQGRHGLRELIYQTRRHGVEIDADPHTVAISTPTVSRDWIDVTETATLTPLMMRTIEGGFLPGYQGTYSQAFAAWLEKFRSVTIARLSQRLLREVQSAVMANDLAIAEVAARSCLAIDPSNGQAAVALSLLTRPVSFPEAFGALWTMRRE